MTMTDNKKKPAVEVNHLCKMPGCSQKVEKPGQRYCARCLFLRMLNYKTYGKAD